MIGIGCITSAAVKVGRIDLRDKRGKWQALALDGKRKVSLAGWLEQAQQFYANALPNADVVATMSRFGFLGGVIE